MTSWSIYWRLLLLCLAFGVVFGIAVNAAYLGNLDPIAIRWKPTLLWWLEAACIWVLTSTVPQFLETLLFAKKLQFSAQVWLRIGQYTCFVLVAAGILGQFVFELSAAAWPAFKLSALPLGLLLVAMVVASKNPHADRKESEPLRQPDARQAALTMAKTIDLSKMAPTLEMKQEAKRCPNGWVYAIEGNYGPNDAVPPEAIAGSWKVDANGNIIEGSFLANPKFKGKK